MPDTDTPVIGLDQVVLGEWLAAHPVDALIDFSMPKAVFLYGEEVRQRQLMLAARLLRDIAPLADVEILEQHFRGKTEVIFGFPYPTVRLIHNSIERKAFGTGAAFALGQLAQSPNGFYTFDDLLMQKVRSQLMAG